MLLVASLRAAKAGAIRSRYRPDVWRIPEWVTVVAGVCASAALVLAGHIGVAGLNPSYSPLEFPTLPLLPVLGVLVAAIPAFATPPLPVELA